MLVQKNRLLKLHAEALECYFSGSSTSASVNSRTESFVLAEEDDPKEWVAQVEPGVLITFVSQPQTENHFKRIYFSREIINKLQAQRWWEENYDKVMELYNDQRLNCQTVPLPTPPRSENELSAHNSQILLLLVSQSRKIPVDYFKNGNTFISELRGQPYKTPIQQRASTPTIPTHNKRWLLFRITWHHSDIRSAAKPKDIIH